MFIGYECSDHWFLRFRTGVCRDMHLIYTEHSHTVFYSKFLFFRVLSLCYRLTEEEIPNRSTVLLPMSLAASIKIDSCYLPCLIPTLQCHLSVGLVDLHLYNHFRCLGKGKTVKHLYNHFRCLGKGKTVKHLYNHFRCLGKGKTVKHLYNHLGKCKKVKLYVVNWRLFKQ